MINNIEEIIINKFLSVKLKISLQEKDIINRNFTGSGFITYFKKSRKFKVSQQYESYKFSDILAKINVSIDTGYLLYIENGYISALEWFTYEENWPNTIDSIDVKISS